MRVPGCTHPLWLAKAPTAACPTESTGPEGRTHFPAAPQKESRINATLSQNSTPQPPHVSLTKSRFRKYFLDSRHQEKKGPFFLWPPLVTYGAALNRGFMGRVQTPAWPHCGPQAATNRCEDWYVHAQRGPQTIKTELPEHSNTPQMFTEHLLSTGHYL